MSDRRLNKQDIRAHLKAMWKTGGNCSVCSSNAWGVLAEEEFCLKAVEELKAFPVALVVCEVCGALQLFSANAIRAKRDGLSQ